MGIKLELVQQPDGQYSIVLDTETTRSVLHKDLNYDHATLYLDGLRDGLQTAMRLIELD